MPETIKATLQGTDAVAYVAVVARLAALLTCSENVVLPSIDPARPGSRMHVARTENVWDAYEQAWRLLSSAEDHLQTIFEILRALALPRYALYSLLRPAVAAAVRMAYLVDLSIAEHRRLGRGLNVRWENLIEQNHVEPNAAHLSARVLHLQERAAANGVEIVRSDANTRATPRLLGFGERRLGEMALVELYMKEGALIYRVLSAHAHAQPWVLLLHKDRLVATDDPHIASMPTDVDTALFGTMLAIVLTRHEQNLADLFVLAGYPRDMFGQALKTALEVATADVLSW